MSSLADEQRFFVVYPLSIGNEWELGVDGLDVDFVDQLITSLSSSYNIDQDRIYAAGFSYGGLFVHDLACALG